MNGWEKGVLAKATAETGGCNCGCACGNEEMKQCFGAENVNDDNDSSFKQCSAKDAYDDLSATHFETLPGCNPIQSGPAAATKATGAGCAAATGVAGSGSGSSNTTATAILASSHKASPTSGSYDEATSVTAPSSKAAATTSVVKPISGHDTAKSSATPTSAGSDLSNKGGANTEGADYELAKPSNNAEAKPTLSVSSDAEKDDEGDCKSHATVTVTPTVYVTVGSAQQPTACSQSPVYKTVTETSTVTVSAGY
jgi:hypothetical protein